MMDEQKVKLVCPACNVMDDYDPVTTRAQIRVCTSCGSEWWMGAVWVASQDANNLQTLMKLLHRSIQSTQLMTALEMLLRSDEDGTLSSFFDSHP